ncbi:hypothetical protein MMC17_005058 [Xylographa soralifera]|nr:hypothetical protein [Xylographa soralifera]
MLTTRIFLTLLLFYSYVTSANNMIQCDPQSWFRTPEPRLVADCHAALNMIPVGTITFDGVNRRPLHFTLPPNARDPKILAPAMFRSGHCAISVLPYRYQDNVHIASPIPDDAASMLYFRLFPTARELAQGIINTCLPEEQTGCTGGDALVELVSEDDGSRIALYTVWVRRLYPGPLGRSPFDTAMNVYQADDSGRITRVRYEV